MISSPHQSDSIKLIIKDAQVLEPSVVAVTSLTLTRVGVVSY